MNFPHKTEKKLYKYLSEQYTDVTFQAKYEWCRPNKRMHPYDFAIDSLKVIIELDGAQHFRQVSNWADPKMTHINDILCTAYANTNGYTVVRLLQEDVLNDKGGWKEQLTRCIHSGKNEYMCQNDEYSTFSRNGYIILKGDNITLVELTDDVKARTGKQVSVVMDIGHMNVPDNITELIVHRFKCILPGYVEDQEYLNNYMLLHMIGSSPPKVVNGKESVVIPSDYKGIYDIPKGTLKISMARRTGVTGFTGSATEMFLADSGLEGTVYVHKGTRFIDLTGCVGVTEVVTPLTVRLPAHLT